MSVFGQRLKEARKQRGWSLTKAEAMLGISVNRITAYENRGEEPHLQMVVKISEVLNVSLDWLCGRSDKGIDITVKQRGIGKDQTKDILSVIPRDGGYDIWVM